MRAQLLNWYSPSKDFQNIPVATQYSIYLIWQLKSITLSEGGKEGGI